MYSPLLGQFAQRDPLDYAAGDENLYRYVGNEPTDGTDPSGEATEQIPGTMRLEDALEKEIMPRQKGLGEVQKDAQGKKYIPYQLIVSPGGIAIGRTRPEARPTNLTRLLDFIKKKNSIISKEHPDCTPLIRLLELHGHSLGPGEVDFATGTGVAGDVKGAGGNPQVFNSSPLAFFGDANVLTAENAEYIGKLLAPYLSDDAVIVLNNCNTGLAKKADQSIAARMAAGSKRKVLATMGFIAGSILDHTAKISRLYEGKLSFYELRAWNKLGELEEESKIRAPGGTPDDSANRDAMIKRMSYVKSWLGKEHKDVLDAFGKYYAALTDANYDSMNNMVRLYPWACKVFCVRSVVWA